MRNTLCRLNIAVSVDGYIATHARDDGAFAPLDTKTGLKDFLDQIGAVVMGRNSYDRLRGLGNWPCAGKRVVVLTKTSVPPPPPTVPPVSPIAQDQSGHTDHPVETWDGSPTALLAKLRKESNGDVWLFGGASVVRQWLDLDLVDSLELFVLPQLLGDGKRLFGPSARQHALELDGATTWPGGITCLRYHLKTQ